MTPVDVNDWRVEVREGRRLPVSVDREAFAELPTIYHLAMYATLCALAGAEHSTAPGLAGLARLAKMGKTKAVEVLDDLDALGVIARTRRVRQDGLDDRTIYKVMGFEALDARRGVRVADTGSPHDLLPGVRVADTVRPATGVRVANTTGCREVRVANTNTVSAVVEPQQQGLVDQLVAVGMDRTSARRLVEERAEECERQLEALPRRKAGRNPAGLLRRAIEEAWSLPVDVPVVSMLPVVEEIREVCARCDNLRNVEEGGEWIRCPDCNPHPAFA